MRSNNCGLLTAVMLCCLTAMLAACGQMVRRDAPSASNPSAPSSMTSAKARRDLPADYLTRKAVAYSGYRGDSHDNPPTQAQVLEDLHLLTKAGFGLIRVFSSGDADNKLVLDTIATHRLDLKVHLGIWISGPRATSDPANQAEIARGIALAKTYPDLVQVVSVGNETMVDWSPLKVPVADMAAYLQQVRAAVAQPVTTDDDWAFYANRDNKYQPRAVLDAIDFVSLHIYPLLDSVYDPSFTEWKHAEIPEAQRAQAMMETMFARARSHFEAVRGYLASQSLELPLVIGEAGWKARITNGETGRAHPVNQKLYLDMLNAWREGPAQIFYFEAFDEPWKGADDGWGLFNVERKARHALAPLFPEAQRETPSHTAADAVHYRPPVADPPR